MCCKNLWKKSIPFFLTFCLGILSANLFSVNEIPLNLLEKKVAPPVEIKKDSSIYQKKDTGTGTSGHSCNPNHFNCLSCKTCKGSSCKVCKDGKLADDKFIPKKETDLQNTKIKFISKPQPKYTDVARAKLIEGKVVLRISFLANGQIGSISPVKTLSDGLTEQAIEAAKKIKFNPAVRNGKPASVTMSVQYTFTIY